MNVVATVDKQKRCAQQFGVAAHPFGRLCTLSSVWKTIHQAKRLLKSFNMISFQKVIVIISNLTEHSKPCAAFIFGAN